MSIESNDQRRLSIQHYYDSMQYDSSDDRIMPVLPEAGAGLGHWALAGRPWSL